MERWLAGRVPDIRADRAVPPMFLPFQLREMRLANRVVVSPMATYSARDGMPNDFHLVHLGARALGGAGLVFTEMVCVTPQGRITPGCAGLWIDEQMRGLGAHRRFRARAIGREVLPAARSFRPEGFDPTRLGGDGCAACRWELGADRALAGALEPTQSDPACDDAG